MAGAIYVDGKRVARLKSIRMLDSGALMAEADHIVGPVSNLGDSAVTLSALDGRGDVHTLGAMVSSVTITDGCDIPTKVALELVTRILLPVPRPSPKPLTLTSAQLRAWRRGESIFRVPARPRLARFATSFERRKFFALKRLAWERHQEPIRLSAERIREWRKHP